MTFMSEVPSETVVRAWTRLVRAQQRVLEGIESRLKQARLPPLAWYDVLWELERGGPPGRRPVAIQRALLLPQYNLSRLIDRMVRKGYVERRACQGDGRGHLVDITARGRAIRRRMWVVYRPAIQGGIGARLSPRQAATLERLLGALAEGPDAGSCGS